MTKSYYVRRMKILLPLQYIFAESVAGHMETATSFSQMLSREVAPIRCAGESPKQTGEVCGGPEPRPQVPCCPLQAVTCWRLANHPGWAGGNGMVRLPSVPS